MQRPHHYINPDGTCHAGDLFEAGSPAKALFTDDQIEVLIFQYSEWLDGQGLVVGDEASGDKRSHTELVKDFMEALG